MTEKIESEDRSCRQEKNLSFLISHSCCARVICLASLLNLPLSVNILTRSYREAKNGKVMAYFHRSILASSNEGNETGTRL
jgi:hypothetical protein